jgi:hypothetical protein
VKKHHKFGFLLGVLTLIAVAFATFAQVQKLILIEQRSYSDTNEQIVDGHTTSFAVFTDSFSLHLGKINPSQKDLKKHGHSTFLFSCIQWVDEYDKLLRTTFSFAQIHTKFRKQDLLFPFQYFW